MCQNLGLHLWCDGTNFTKNILTQQFYNFKTKCYFYGVLAISFFSSFFFQNIKTKETQCQLTVNGSYLLQQQVTVVYSYTIHFHEKK